MYVTTKEQFHDAVRRIGNNDPTLTTFHLDYGSAFCKSLDGYDVNRLLAALSKNTHLDELYFDRNRSGHEHAIMLSEIIVNDNLPLQALSLSCSKIYHDGAAALAKAIAGNKSLTRLCLDGNKIGDRGAAAFAMALEGNSTLEFLSLDNNNVGCDGAIALLNALKKNTAMEELNLGSNRIGCKAARALSNALEENATVLTRLYLHDNIIKENGLKAIEGALKVNTRLVFVRLHHKDHNDTCKSIMRSIDQMLDRNRVLDGHKRCIEETDTTFYVCREEGNRRFQWAPLHYTADDYNDVLNEQEPIWQALVADGMALRLVNLEFYEIVKNDPADVAALKTLIENERDVNGDTLLHRAATKDCSAAVDMCLFLIEKVGIDPHRVLNRTGRSVYNVASKSMPILRKMEYARWCRDAQKPDSAAFADALIDIVEEPWCAATALHCVIREKPEIVDPIFWNASVTDTA